MAAVRFSRSVLFVFFLVLCCFCFCSCCCFCFSYVSFLSDERHVIDVKRPWHCKLRGPSILVGLAFQESLPSIFVVLPELPEFPLLVHVVIRLFCGLLLEHLGFGSHT